MSPGVVTLQAQVESVLGELVKAATVELTKLFESRYQASTGAAAAGRTEAEGSEAPCGSPGDTTRSIGVQVDADMYPLVAFPELPLLSDGTCLEDCRQVALEGHTAPSGISLAEVNEHADPHWLPTMEQIVAETLDMVEFRILDMESDIDTQSEVDLHADKQPKTETTCDPELDPPDQQETLAVLPDMNQPKCEGEFTFVCPLILKLDSPEHAHDGSEKRVKTEPEQACASTAKGAAYSPSPADGAATPARRAWEQHQKNHLQIKLEPPSYDTKLGVPCTVPLVDVVLSRPRSVARSQSEAAEAHTVHQERGLQIPRDLRIHQGPHTGHRLCCYTNCGTGLWRLVEGVTHSRDGHACSACGKTFKRRKILRRHQRFHSGEKPYSCKVCAKTFALRKSLRRHLRFHTGERPHTCSHCGKSFRLRDNLKAHLRFHTGEKPFNCSVCGKNFRIMRNLETHNLSQCEAFIPSFRTIAGMPKLKTGVQVSKNVPLSTSY